MTEEMQTQFRSEGDPVFPTKNEENDNSAASSAEETTTDADPSQGGEQKPSGKKDGGDENFADHPRWQEREEDWKKRFNEQETRHTQEIAKLREDMTSALSQNKNTRENQAPTKIPSWFGGDQEQWDEFMKWNGDLLAQAEARGAEKALGEIKSKSEAEQKAIDDATQYFKDEVVAIESDKKLNPEGKKVDQHKLLKFVLDNDLVDSQGRWNYRAAWLMMRGSATKAQEAAVDEKKKLAGATTSENRAETKQQPFATSSDFEKPGSRPW